MAMKTGGLAAVKNITMMKTPGCAALSLAPWLQPGAPGHIPVNSAVSTAFGGPPFFPSLRRTFSAKIPFH